MSFFGVKTKPVGALETVEYDENYEDGLGSALDEANDDFNDETFGSDLSSLKQKDFDFAGQTAQHAPQIDSGQVAWDYHRPPTTASTGSNSHQKSQSQQQQQYVPKLQPIASLWGEQPEQPKKFLSVEEVEAEMMRSSASPSGPGAGGPMQQQQQQPPHLGMYPQHMMGPAHHQMMQMDPWGSSFQGMRMPPMQAGAAGAYPGGMNMPPAGYPMNMPMGGPPGPGPHPQPQSQLTGHAPGPGSVSNLGPGPGGFVGGPTGGPQAGPQPGLAPQNAPPGLTAEQQQQQQVRSPDNLNLLNQDQHQQQAQTVPVALDQLMAEDKMAHEAEQVKDTESSRKLAQMEKLNGLMSQWDKNFIMRIQLQQMVSKDQYNDDFYYQVHSAIEAQRNPHQPVNALAKTYMLLNRGRKNRRHQNDNPLQKMQQQVKDAVEAARDHPKREQITVEGALGRLQVSSGARPRRALNLHGRSPSDVPDAGDGSGSDGDNNSTNKAASSSRTNAASTLSALNSRTGTKTRLIKQDTMRSLEDIYAVLLEIESTERSAPQDQSRIESLLVRLWDLIQVQEHGESKETQPFILMLSHDKGKKLIPRLFRHLDSTQRLTVLTRIVAHIDCLDVVKNGSYVTANGSVDVSAVNARSRESIELFTQTVLPPLVQLISDSPFDVVIGLLDIMIQNQHILPAAFTKVGLAILTVLISRAELLNQEGAVSGADQESWKYCFETLFSRVKGHMAALFPPRTVEDSYVWHFLAALALAAKLDSQRVIVDEVRDRIFGTMAEAKALPPELGAVKISNLNLFLNVMGLNATTTEITELKE